MFEFKNDFSNLEFVFLSLYFIFFQTDLLILYSIFQYKHYFKCYLSFKSINFFYFYFY